MSVAPGQVPPWAVKTAQEIVANEKDITKMKGKAGCAGQAVRGNHHPDHRRAEHCRLAQRQSERPCG